MFEYLAIVDPASEESALIERIAELERLKAAAAAGQARAAAALDAARRAADAAVGVPAARRGRGVASEVALARLDSPARGNRHLGFAKALVHEMPHTLAALEAGALTEWRATLIVRESACLDVDDRRALDAELCGDQAELQGMGDARVAAAAKTIAYRLDPRAVVDRAAKAETERTVTIRPAPDTMTYLTALLPVAQGVSVYAALRREADTLCRRALARPGDGRHAGRAGHRAQRGSGDADRGQSGVVRRNSLRCVQRACQCKRLWSHPGGCRAGFGFRCRQRQTVSRSAAPSLCTPDVRRPGGNGVQSATVSTRTGRLSSSFVISDAAHRTATHRFAIATTLGRGSVGGQTSANNGLGLCERCNYVKEVAGWSVKPNVDEIGRHTAQFTTPTGAHYWSAAPPRAPTITTSDVEVRIGIALARHAA